MNQAGVAKATNEAMTVHVPSTWAAFERTEVTVKWKSVLQLFLVQLVQYCIVSISYIAMNRGQYMLTAATDTVFGFNAFFIVKRIIKSEATLGWEAAGYTAGGVLGSMIAIYASKHWLHQ